MTDKHSIIDGSRVFSSSSGDHFDGFFGSGKKWQLDKASLVDNGARRVFDLASRA